MKFSIERALAFSFVLGILATGSGYGPGYTSPRWYYYPTSLYPTDPGTSVLGTITGTVTITGGATIAGTTVTGTGTVTGPVVLASVSIRGPLALEVQPGDTFTVPAGTTISKNDPTALIIGANGTIDGGMATLAAGPGSRNAVTGNGTVTGPVSFTRGGFVSGGVVTGNGTITGPVTNITPQFPPLPVV